MYEEYLEKLKEEGVIRNRKEGTIETYTANVNKFLNWANKKPKELTLEDCKKYIWELRVNCKFSTQHCNGVNSALKFFFRYVLRKPWDQDIVPRMINDIVLPKAITLDEVKKLIDSAELIRNKAIIALLYSSGLRVSELCRLEFGDIYFSTNQVHIRGGKNHQDHWTILSETSKDLLMQYWRSYGLISCRCKKDKMTLCRNILGCKQYLSQLRGKNVVDKIKLLYNRDICKCDKCGGHMTMYKVSGRYMLC